MAKKPQHIFQLKVTLAGTKPPIWRRLLVTDTITLPLFHSALQTAMGWTDSHLHMFIAGRDQYGMPDPDWDNDIIPETKVQLGSLLQNPKDKLIYEYDFGDSWEHRIVLEKVLPFDPETVTPVCTGGKRNCPPEDVGGVWGYEEFLEAINNPSHEDYDNMLEWAGDDFDPEQFNINNINAALKKSYR